LWRVAASRTACLLYYCVRQHNRKILPLCCTSNHNIRRRSKSTPSSFCRRSSLQPEERGNTSKQMNINSSPSASTLIFHGRRTWSILYNFFLLSSLIIVLNFVAVCHTVWAYVGEPKNVWTLKPRPLGMGRG